MLNSKIQHVIEANNILKEAGIKAKIIALPTVLPLDEDLIRATAAETKKVVTVEEHYINGGMGSMVTELLSDMDDVTVKRLGIPNIYATTSSNYQELLAYYGLDAKGIAKSVKAYLGK